MQHGLTLLYRSADGLAAGCFLAIGYLSLTPLTELPELPGSDKLYHLTAYALLAFFAILSRKTKTVVLAVLCAVIAYGGLIEVIQPYVNRTGEFGDFLADATGAVLGGLAVYGVSRVKA